MNMREIMGQSILPKHSYKYDEKIKQYICVRCFKFDYKINRKRGEKMRPSEFLKERELIIEQDKEYLISEINPDDPRITDLIKDLDKQFIDKAEILQKIEKRIENADWVYLKRDLEDLKKDLLGDEKWTMAIKIIRV